MDEFLVAPLKESVRQRIRDAETARSDPSQANGAAHRLVAKFSSYLPILTKLMAGRDGYDLSGLFDEVVSACLSCAIAYYNATRRRSGIVNNSRNDSAVSPVRGDSSQSRREYRNRKEQSSCRQVSAPA